MSWFTFDNTTGSATPFGQPVTATRGQASAPPGLPTASGTFARVDIKAITPSQPSWSSPVQAYFRRDGASWKLVGFERLPDGAHR
jgi:hypothetical protein